MKAQRSKENPGLFRTDGGKTKSNAIQVPSVSLPKGGGALKGIDEKFSVNAVNGTVSFSIPLPQAPARGISPNFSLGYNSGSGNGIFGLGWDLSGPSIKRKTDKGLPRYIDAIDSDTFLFSEAEDLVPEFKKHDDGHFILDSNDDYIIHETDSTDGLYTIRRYRPRVEGLFARIERWSAKASAEMKWRVINKENITTLFGWSAEARIADPDNEYRVYEWLPEFVFDDKGNCAHYRYKPEDATGFVPALLHHRNRMRDGKITYTNRYPEKVFYGNKTPYPNFAAPFPSENDYLFSNVFDYGEYDLNTHTQTGEWAFRSDAFSDYKAGFEIRTTRLCRRMLLFHHFTGAGEYNGLVKSANFTYNTSAEEDFTFLESFTAHGYIKKGDGTYSRQNLPPANFSYQKHDWNKTVSNIRSDDLVHAPSGLNEPRYQFTDLYNEGLAGILTEQAGAWYYKQNLGGGSFEPAKSVSPKPTFMGLGNVMQLTDLDADGGKQLVNYGTEPKGYFEKNDDDEWLRFRPFEALPNIDFNHPDTKMIDLNGDGMAELLVAEDNVFTWYASEGRKGFSPAQQTARTFDEEQGPHMVFSDTVQSIFLADMCGDGLTDIVRIKNGEVCYWPNLGYGKFGCKVALDQAPVFDHPDAFNPKYIRLADIDGSGTTDIIYLGKNKFTCWKNLSGNRFGSTPFEVDAFPEIHNNAQVSVTDLLGNGVACIVWSSALQKDAQSPLRYIDLMNGKKPHLMVSYRNNMGKEVRWEYAPSTRFYLQDKKAGRPWVTKLHFPVHCVSKTETLDHIAGHRLVNTYTYHHGYYDHAEREFRGFGRVEQTDSESFDHWVKGNASNIVEEPLHQEPVIVKTWTHTGAFLGREKIVDGFTHEYWHKEMIRQGFMVTHKETDLPEARITVAPGLDAALVDHLSAQEWREALRACKNMPLRTETFAYDAAKYGNTPDARRRELIPYTAASSNCVIELLQPKGKNNHAVFVAKESESITYAYERDEKDPRIAHSLNLKLDEYAHVLESASVVYPRLTVDASLPLQTRQDQQKPIITYTKSQYTNDVFADDVHRIRLASEVQTFQLKGVPKAGIVYALADFTDILSDTHSDTALYHETEKMPAGKPLKRLIEHIRSTYYSNLLTGPLSLHHLHSLALPCENFQLAYSPELLADIFGGKANPALMAEGKFTHSEGDSQWWIRSGTTRYIQGAETPVQAQGRFYVPVSHIDPFGGINRVTYDPYSLFIKNTEDSLGNKAGVETFNYRTLTPQKMKDTNGNFSEAIMDELGLVKATAVSGKGTEADELAGHKEITDAAETLLINNFIQATTSTQLTLLAKNLLQRASSRFIYDFNAYQQNGKPALVAVIQREEHYKKNNDSPIQISFEYTDGTGDLILKKDQAEPGIAKQVIVNADNSISITEINTAATTPKELRWIGNGRSIKNNKGNAVKQYEPYFSVTHRYEDVKELVEVGETPILYYDALGRLLKTEMPDGTFGKVEFDAWRQKVYDANDTLLESAWYKNRSLHLMDAELLAEGKDPVKEKEAADKTVKHAGTPNVLHFDTMGKPILSVDHIRNISTDADEFLYTRLKLDPEGNLRSVTDARGNTVMEYKYDMLGQLVYQTGMDSGQRWLLVNIAGKPLRTWDERGHQFQYFYDIAQRPTHSKVLDGDGPSPLDHIVGRIQYGESLLAADRSNETVVQAKNLLGQAIKQYDTGGLINTPEYDFEGHPLSVTRTLFKKYKEVANWTDANLLTDLESETFTFETEIDALGRVVQQKTPDGSTITPLYNEAGLLNSEQVQHPGDAVATAYIKNIDYNEKGQRQKIVYGNDVLTVFHYDKKTLRLNRLESTRDTGDPLQDWRYTYDAIGNITHVEDKNIPTVFFDNKKVEGVCEYTYDALYRLVEAKGRENDAGLGFGPHDNWNDAPFMRHLNPGDPMSVRNYVENYRYDEVGNMAQIRHTATGNTWTRDYTYQTLNNRLNQTQVDGHTFDYLHHTQHGYITQMPHLDDMGWNFKEELVRTVRQKRSDGGTPETTYYQYDGQGQRIRKITENEANPGQTPTKKEERIYVSGYELFKKHSGSNAGLERISLSLLDDAHRFVMIETRNDVDDGTEKRLVRYQMHNHLGSASLELDESARVITYEEYHPFGTTAYQAKNAGIKAAAKRYRYTGVERDEETGLAYHSARYYIPWLGRWLSADPTGIADGANLYAYASSRPIIGNDIDGKALNFIAGAIGAGVGALIGGGIEAGVQLYRHGTVNDWGSVGASAVGGAVSGGMAGVTMGGSLVVQAGVAGVSSVAGGATTRALTGQEQSARSSAMDFTVGVVTFGIVRGGSSAISQVTQQTERQVAQQVVRQTEQQVVRQTEQQVVRQTEQQVVRQAEQRAVQQTEQQAVRTATPRPATPPAAPRAASPAPAARAATPRPPRPPRPPAPRPPAPRPAPANTPRPAAPIGNLRFVDTNVIIRAARGGANSRTARELLSGGRNYITQRTYNEFMRGANRQQSRFLQRLIDSGRVRVVRANTARALSEREGFNAVDATLRGAHGSTDSQLAATTRAAQQTAPGAVYVGEGRLANTLNQTNPQLGVNATRLPE